jgi:hypothetical protein
MEAADKIEPKILIIIGHALYEPWSSILYKGQLKTWAVNQDVSIYHTFANPVSGYIRRIDAFMWKLKWASGFGKYFTAVELLFKFPFRAQRGTLIQEFLPSTNENSLRINMPDLDMLMNFKSFGVITGTLDFDYDFLVSTTTSSYLNVEKLKRRIAELPRTGVIGGRVVEQNSVKFASGSFRIFSRDVVENFLIHRKLFSTWRPEDQAFGFLTKDSGKVVEYVSMGSVDIDSLASLNELTNVDLSNVVHFRLKSGSLKNRGDIDLMINLHEKLRVHKNRAD